MKNKILAFLVSKFGGVLTPVIATVVAAIIARIALFDAQLAGRINEAELTAFAVAAILALVNYFTNKEQVAGVKQIQALVNTDVDGVAGPITYTEVRRAVSKSPKRKTVRSRKK